MRCMQLYHNMSSVDLCNSHVLTNLFRTLGSEKVQHLYQRTGAPLHPAYALPQLMSFYDNNDKQVTNRVHRWQSISSICLHRWTGGGSMKNLHSPLVEMPISYSEASWTGMFDFRHLAWDGEAMDVLESRGTATRFTLPHLIDFDFSCNASIVTNGITSLRRDGTNNPYWERWPELRGKSLDGDNKENGGKTSQHCRLFLGIGDGAAANIGSKCGEYAAPDCCRIAVTIGTSAAARVCLPLSASETKLKVPVGLFCYRVDKYHVLVGGALTDGGSVVEWARNLMNLQEKEAFAECLDKVSDMYRSEVASSFDSRTASSISMIPFLSGERSTGYRGGATACISGMSRDTSSSHVMYACLEGVNLRLNAILSLIQGVVCNNESSGQSVLVASGNALEKNLLWRQMLADCTGMGIVVDSDAKEGTSRGVAMLVARCLRKAEDSDDLSDNEPLVVESEAIPNPSAEARWKRAILKQESLLNAVSMTWNADLAIETYDKSL